MTQSVTVPASLGATHALADQGATVGDYLALLKPRVMSLVLFTAFVGMVLAPGTIHPLLGAIGLVAIALGAGASAAFNMGFEGDIDRLMVRTQGRPVPRGRIAREDALGFGGILAFFAVLLMMLAVNYLAAALLALTIAFYVGVYTLWLKRRTPQNIVIGGAAGALPPLIGWAAVTGSVSLQPLVLFLIIFMWTPPHFWALALFRGADYERAGLPMMPVVRGTVTTCNHILAYSLILVPLAFAPLALGFGGALYAAVAALAGAVFLVLAVRVWRERAGGAALERAARALFGFSILYLALLFAALLGERLVGLSPLIGALS